MSSFTHVPADVLRFAPFEKAIYAPMISLKGIAHSSGIIEFTRLQNPWAFQRMDAGLKEGQEKRIVVKPEIAPIEIALSPHITEADVPWLERIRLLLRTADMVYLQRSEESLRFRQAVHETGPNQKLITLGSQAEVNEYAAEFWSRALHFFALRHDGFRFDINSMTCRDNEERVTEKIEVAGRLVPGAGGSLPTLTFDATGSGANVHLVSWRSSIKDGESGKFAPDGAHICLSVANNKQPFTFCHDYRATLKSHTYIFQGEKMDQRLKKLARKRF
jgi:hypothetical protein